MCICVNCRHVNNCITYNFVKQQHKSIQKNQRFLSFMPTNTIININIQKSQFHTTFDLDLSECLSFTEQPGKWLIK